MVLTEANSRPVIALQYRDTGDQVVSVVESMDVPGYERVERIVKTDQGYNITRDRESFTYHVPFTSRVASYVLRWEKTK